MCIALQPHHRLLINIQCSLRVRVRVHILCIHQTYAKAFIQRSAHARVSLSLIRCGLAFVCNTELTWFSKRHRIKYFIFIKKAVTIRNDWSQATWKPFHKSRKTRQFSTKIAMLQFSRDFSGSVFGGSSRVLSLCNFVRFLSPHCFCFSIQRSHCLFFASIPLTNYSESQTHQPNIANLHRAKRNAIHIMFKTKTARQQQKNEIERAMLVTMTWTVGVCMHILFLSCHRWHTHEIFLYYIANFVSFLFWFLAKFVCASSMYVQSLFGRSVGWMVPFFHAHSVAIVGAFSKNVARAHRNNVLCWTEPKQTSPHHGYSFCYLYKRLHIQCNAVCICTLHNAHIFRTHYIIAKGRRTNNIKMCYHILFSPCITIFFFLCIPIFLCAPQKWIALFLTVLKTFIINIYQYFLCMNFQPDSFFLDG